MKKLKKKTGRRAARKRRRMERLLNEVAPCDLRETDSDQAAQDRNPSRISQDQGASLSGVVSCDPTIPVKAAKSELADGVESLDRHQPANSGQRSNQLRKMTASGSHRRRSRMQRIRKLLENQKGVYRASDRASEVAADGRSSTDKVVTERDRHKPGHLAPDSSRHEALENAVQRVSNDPQEKSDPTAQSMAAMAGAVTALASAIQFRLTDPPDRASKRDSPVADPVSTPNQPSGVVVPSSFSAVASLSEKPVEDKSTSLGSGQPSAKSTKEVSDETECPSSLGDDAAAEEFNSEPVESVESLFGSDESDRAGAYSVIAPGEQPEESYGAWFRRTVVDNRWVTWFTAFYVHWLIALLMMVVLVHGPDQTARLLLNGAFADEPTLETEPFEMDVQEPLAMEEPVEPEEVAAELPTEQITASEMAETPVAISDSILKQFSNEPNEAEETAPVASKMKTAPTPARSVSQGSFSVWTEPEFPIAGEPYRIIVQIQLPPGTESYHLRDLNGVVVGSDGYRKPIPGMSPRSLPIVDSCVRMAIPIVSADEQVRDTIYIGSKLLKETQKLLIEF